MNRQTQIIRETEIWAEQGVGVPSKSVRNSLSGRLHPACGPGVACPPLEPGQGSDGLDSDGQQMGLMTWDYYMRTTHWILLVQKSLNPSHAEATLNFRPWEKNAKRFENHLNLIMLVFIGELSQSTIRWVPICHGLSHFHGFLHHFELTKLATISQTVKEKLFHCGSGWSGNSYMKRWEQQVCTWDNRHKTSISVILNYAVLIMQIW